MTASRRLHGPAVRPARHPDGSEWSAAASGGYPCTIAGMPVPGAGWRTYPRARCIRGEQGGQCRHQQGAHGVDAKFRLRSVFPWGTFAADAGAALLLGFLSEAVTDGDFGPLFQLLLATGFCGALSTWSTFSYELLTLTSARHLGIVAGYLLLSIGAGVGLSFAGAAVAGAVH
ncbi:CrcB family protein [Streptomyces sp. NPDC088246]|uniref:FluC/FEX family fluoride channel n=1 Tax=Streptomyces sp. NPDC088246 TaxID=3365842 RepID=UPI0037FF59ED